MGLMVTGKVMRSGDYAFFESCDIFLLTQFSNKFWLVVNVICRNEFSP
jgi:hypothetical protein